LALPAWLAVTVQVPAITSDSVVPLTVQTLSVVDAKDTASPEDAVATSAGGAMPRVWLPGDVKVIVWEPGATVKERETGAAAAKLALPAWLAAIVQVPAPASVSAVPLTVHTLNVVDANDTGRPDDAVATNAPAATPKVWLAGCAKVMVCVAGETLNVFDTFAAAAYVASPAWLATTVQLPAPANVKVVPLTVHTLGVVEAKATVRPEVDVADRAAGAVPSV
jgi:hypothetical protein